MVRIKLPECLVVFFSIDKLNIDRHVPLTDKNIVVYGSADPSIASNKEVDDDYTTKSVKNAVSQSIFHAFNQN